MNLHYSQTIIQRHQFFKKFYYLMNLHYSQTMLVLLISGLMFYYLMNLHYSQTIVVVHTQCQSFTTLWIYTTLKPTSSLGGVAFTVLLPYEFTLLSNSKRKMNSKMKVLLPYEFTLLSNYFRYRLLWGSVLLPYEFTLLSNQTEHCLKVLMVLLPYEFTLLSNEYVKGIFSDIRFTTLWIYTTLKHYIV